MYVIQWIIFKPLKVQNVVKRNRNFLYYLSNILQIDELLNDLYSVSFVNRIYIKCIIYHTSFITLFNPYT